MGIVECLTAALVGWCAPPGASTEVREQWLLWEHTELKELTLGGAPLRTSGNVGSVAVG